MNRKIISLIICLLSIFYVNSQDICGYWEGKISISEESFLTVGLQIDRVGDSLVAELDSPDQYFIGQPVANIEFSDSALTFSVPELQVTFSGVKISKNIINGVFRQRKADFDLRLEKGKDRKFFNRPQTPKPPFNYRTEELNFKDRKGRYRLISGTLTLPESPKALVIFVSGSGWQDRDETLFAHKPFAVLAHELALSGFASFRYDDFPVSVFQKSTTYDFADAVALIIDSLRNIDELKNLKIGILGHSEGSLIAFIEAARNTDVAFTVHLGGISQHIYDILVYQSAEVFKCTSSLSESEIDNSVKISAKIYQIIKNENDRDECAKKISAFWDETADKLTEEEKVLYQLTSDRKMSVISSLVSPWYFQLFHIDPKVFIKKVKTPVLAISGDKDIQIEAEKAQFYMRKYLKNSKLNEFHIINNANHMLQPCESGCLSEYSEIETTISPEIFPIIISWLDRVVK